MEGKRYIVNNVSAAWFIFVAFVLAVTIESCALMPKFGPGFEEGKMCANASGPQKPVEFIFAYYRLDNPSDDDNDELLKKSWMPILLGLNNKTNLEKLDPRYQVLDDGFLAQRFRHSNMAMVFLSDKPPFRIVFCSSYTKCHGKVEPFSKTVLHIEPIHYAHRYGNVVSDGPRCRLWRRSNTIGSISDGCGLLQFLRGIIPPVWLFADYTGFIPARFMEKHTFWKEGREIAAKDGLKEVLEKDIAIGESKNGDWKIISIKFDPTRLCRYMRPLAKQQSKKESL